MARICYSQGRGPPLVCDSDQATGWVLAGVPNEQFARVPVLAPASRILRCCDWLVPGQLPLRLLADVPRHLAEHSRFDLSGPEWLDDGHETAAPGEEDRPLQPFDHAHDAGCLLEEILRGDDEILIVIDPRCRVLRP